MDGGCFDPTDQDMLELLLQSALRTPKLMSSKVSKKRRNLPQLPPPLMKSTKKLDVTAVSFSSGLYLANNYICPKSLPFG